MLKGRPMGTARKVQVNVGSLADMGKRFTQAWIRLLPASKSTKTTSRFSTSRPCWTHSPLVALICFASVRFTSSWQHRELAIALGRDYKNVHQDVAVLEATGLLIREGRKLSAPWDELQAHVSLLPS
jgi:hypothetical protein